MHHTTRAISSVGRAPPLQGGGHWFETGIAHHLFLVYLYSITKQIFYIHIVFLGFL